MLSFITVIVVWEDLFHLLYQSATIDMLLNSFARPVIMFWAALTHTVFLSEHGIVKLSLIDDVLFATKLHRQVQDIFDC